MSGRVVQQEARADQDERLAPAHGGQRIQLAPHRGQRDLHPQSAEVVDLVRDLRIAPHPLLDDFVGLHLSHALDLQHQVADAGRGRRDELLGAVAALGVAAPEAGGDGEQVFETFGQARGPVRVAAGGRDRDLVPGAHGVSQELPRPPCAPRSFPAAA